jgi:hypothetical protein
MRSVEEVENDILNLQQQLANLKIELTASKREEERLKEWR